MKPINKKQAIYIAVVVVAVIVVAGIAMMVGQKPGIMPGGAQPSNNSNSAGTNPAGGSSPSSTAPVTRLPVPTNISVPEAGASTSSAGGVAVPQVESAAAPGVSAKYRSFDITLQNGAFTPSTIAVNQGDTVNLNITALDGSYDFTQPDFGFKYPLPQGESKQIGFEATAPGKFIFYCAACGGPSKGPVGYLLVAGK